MAARCTDRWRFLLQPVSGCRAHTLATHMHTRDRGRKAKGISPRVRVIVAHCVPVGLSGTDSAKMSYVAGRRKHDIEMTPS